MEEENNSDSEIEDILEAVGTSDEEDSEEEKNDEGDEFEPEHVKEKKITNNHTIRYSNNKITSDYLTINEYSSCMAIRARQIATSGIHFSDIISTDSFELAKNEFEIGKCPLTIFRQVGNEVEKCDLSHLKF